VKLYKDGSNKMSLYRDMSYRQGMRYTIKFYARGQSGGEEVGIMMRVFAGGSYQCQPDIDIDGFHNIWLSKDIQSWSYTLTNNWREYVYKFQLPSDNSTALFKFEINTPNAAVYLDYIRAYPEWTPHPTILNVYGIHWDGNVYGNEFLMNSAERLSVIGGDQEENVLNHEISFSTNPYNIFWFRNDSGSPMKSSIQLEVSAAPYTIYISGKIHLVFKDLEIYGAGADYPNVSAAFLIKDAENITVSDCKIYLAKTHALSVINSMDIIFSNNDIFFAGSWGINASSNSNNVIVSNNSAHHCGNAKQDNSDGHGIGTNSANNILIELNDVYANGSGGGDGNGNMRAAIMLYNTANSCICRNRVHDNYRAGIDIAASTGAKNISNNEVCYNLIYNNGFGSPAGNTYHFGIGLRMNQSVISENNKVCNNVIYNNDFSNAGQVHQGALKLTSVNNASITKTVIKNNILYNNISGYELSKFTSGGGIVDVDLDNNIYYRSGAGKIIFWEGAQDWDTYHNVNRNEPGSINKNPLFISEATSDFHLKSTSPAIDAGIAVGISSDFAGNPVKSKPDIGAFEFMSLE
jgi:hypothetical protein